MMNKNIFYSCKIFIIYKLLKIYDKICIVFKIVYRFYCYKNEKQSYEARRCFLLPDLTQVAEFLLFFKTVKLCV